MSALKPQGNASGTGTHTLQSSATNSTITQTLPLVGNTTLGYLNAPANSQSAAYTLVADDAGEMILHPASDASARTFTIPANASVAFEVGTVVTFVNMSAGVVTIAITSDTLRQAGTGSTGSRSLAQYGIATAIKVGTTEWLISGNGLT